jgi:chromosome condensin MukBEF ATPase and DNA-binding subunit MukB
MSETDQRIKELERSLSALQARAAQYANQLDEIKDALAIVAKYMPVSLDNHVHEDDDD